MSALTSLEARFNRAQDAVLVREEQLSFPAICSAYARVLEGFLPLAPDAATALEMRRRIAENLFCAACAKGCPVDEVLRRRADWYQLGLPVLEDRLPLTKVFARYCINHGHPECALEDVADLIDEASRDPDQFRERAPLALLLEELKDTSRRARRSTDG